LSSGILLPRSWAALSLVLGLLALLLGSVAEIQSRSWSSDGQGKWIARLAITEGLIAVATSWKT
ncbi:MAG: hypothetical protein M1608_01850, partial [Candidatus Omnitrophica bacterium]|nr:hypothetical protein [Candidatus Omnitrophota bacterium]